MNSAKEAKYKTMVHDLEQLKTFNELDYNISSREVIDAIKRLKCNKSEGPDSIKTKC